MKRKKQKPGNKQSLAKFKKLGETYKLVEYEITYEAMKILGLPALVEERLPALHEMVKSNPKQAIPELLTLKENYPDIPVLYNYLCMAYEFTGNRAASREIIIENYQKSPDYLFAKINYAQVCLYEGNTDKIPEIFDGKFDLSLIYPERTRYHVSEFTGFAGVMCAYFASIGKTETAHVFYKTLLKLAPNEGTTRFAASFLFPTVMSKLKRLLGT